jgi:GNAT superfamily N-acetyltransferase
VAEISLQLLDGAQAGAHADELLELHGEVYGPDDGTFAARYRTQRRQPGFVLAEARNGGYLVGYAFGMPLRPSTSWWRQLTAPLPEAVTTEHPGRTFALADLAVRASWRRQGTGRDLHDLILRGRPEERATAVLAPAAAPAQHAFRSWGWRKVARTRDEAGGELVSDVLITALRSGLYTERDVARAARPESVRGPGGCTVHQ